MEGVMDFEAVRALLPQRHPFIMIDRVLEIEPGSRIVCLKNISGNEPYFPGHFPDLAIMPGALILEAFAQASILLFRAGSPDESSDDKVFLFGTVKARMREPVFPGDQLRIEVTLEKAVSTGAIVEARGLVDGNLKATARLGFGLTDRSALAP